jgi:hypothetical protein
MNAWELDVFPRPRITTLDSGLLEAEYRIIYIPEAVLYHRAWRNEQNHLLLRWSYGRGHGAYLAKHLSLSTVSHSSCENMSFEVIIKRDPDMKSGRPESTSLGL